MTDISKIEEFWDDNPIDVSTEVNFIWSIANKLRGPYQSDKYKDVIIPMVIIRRLECALQETKDVVVTQYLKMPTYPAKAMYKISGYQFYNTSEFTLAELVNDAEHLALNFKSYINGFSPNIQDIIHFLRREMLDFTAFPVFFVSNLLLVQRKKYYFNRAMVSRNCSIVL